MTAKVAFVFHPGMGDHVEASLYHSTAFCAGLADAGIDPVFINVGDPQAFRSRPLPGPGVAALDCHERDGPASVRATAAELVQTFGDEIGLGAIWNAAADIGVPSMHFVGPHTEARMSSRALLVHIFDKFKRGRQLEPSVVGLLGSNRPVLARILDLNLFPNLRLSRVIVPPVDLSEAVSPMSVPSAQVPNFGVYDPRGDRDVMCIIGRAIDLAGNSHLFRVKLASPARQAGERMPANVDVVCADDIADFLSSIDILILSHDADHLVACLVMALRAGKTVIVPDGGVASELVEFGRYGLLYSQGNAYDLAMKINIATHAQGAPPLAFRAGEAVAAKCAPYEVGRAFAAAFRSAMMPATGG